LHALTFRFTISWDWIEQNQGITCNRYGESQILHCDFTTETLKWKISPVLYRG
jgi:hypothetical protein